MRDEYSFDYAQAVRVKYRERVMHAKRLVEIDADIRHSRPSTALRTNVGGNPHQPDTANHMQSHHSTTNRSNNQQEQKTMTKTVTKSSNLSASLAKLLAIASAVAGLALISPASHAQDSLMASGQWKDPKTGLIWMRCSIGQKWNGSTCTGKAIKLTWSDAFEYTRKFINEKQRFGGHGDWRLPTVAELTTIRYCSNGWTRNIKNKKVSELTENGRVTRTVRQDLGVLTATVPSATGSVTVPEYCADGSSHPTINTRIFPATVDAFYWSSSPYANDASSAWGVHFNDGNDYLNDKDFSYYVRLVRGGQ